LGGDQDQGEEGEEEGDEDEQEEGDEEEGEEEEEEYDVDEEDGEDKAKGGEPSKKQEEARGQLADELGNSGWQLAPPYYEVPAPLKKSQRGGRGKAM
jgi:hypothetical protein